MYHLLSHPISCLDPLVKHINLQYIKLIKLTNKLVRVIIIFLGGGEGQGGEETGESEPLW